MGWGLSGCLALAALMHLRNCRDAEQTEWQRNEVEPTLGLEFKPPGENEAAKPECSLESTESIFALRPAIAKNSGAYG